MDDSERAVSHVTVKVWSGRSIDSYESILADSPDEYEMAILDPETYYVPHDDHVELSDEIEHYGTYAFDVETDAPVSLVIETSDSYHDPEGDFRRGRPVEGGLRYAPEVDAEPFKCEIWGRIRMRVEAGESYE